MKFQGFKFWHSIAGVLVLVIFEWGIVRFFPTASFVAPAILIASMLGSIIAVFVSTEIIEDVRGARSCSIRASEHR